MRDAKKYSDDGDFSWGMFLGALLAQPTIKRKPIRMTDPKSKTPNPLHPNDKQNLRKHSRMIRRGVRHPAAGKASHYVSLRPAPDGRITNVGGRPGADPENPPRYVAKLRVKDRIRNTDWFGAGNER